MPVAHLKQFTFTPETARLAGQRSGELRHARSQRKALAKVTGSPDSVTATIERQLELILDQIKRTREALEQMDSDSWGHCSECKRSGADGKERAAVLRALQGLLEHECRLRGIGEPGRLRPVNEPTRQSRRSSPIEPIACAPNTPTGCSPESQPTQSQTTRCARA